MDIEMENVDYKSKNISPSINPDTRDDEFVDF